MNIRKIAALLIAFSCAAAIISCGDKNADDNNKDTEQTEQTEQTENNENNETEPDDETDKTETDSSEGGVSIDIGSIVFNIEFDITTDDPSEEDVLKAVEILHKRMIAAGFETPGVTEAEKGIITMYAVPVDKLDMAGLIATGKANFEIKDGKGNTVVDNSGIKSTMKVELGEEQAVLVNFAEEARENIKKMSAEAAGYPEGENRFDVMFNGEIITSAAVKGELDITSWHVTNGFSEDEAQAYAAILATDELPIELAVKSK